MIVFAAVYLFSGLRWSVGLLRGLLRGGWWLGFCVLLLARSVAAQSVVEPGPDWASYATAAVNPGMATWQAARSADPKCELTRLALSEAVGNGVTLAVKHFVTSPRPCLGCTPDGMPSGHTMNSAIGWRSWGVGLTFIVGTGELRQAAHRHTATQVVAGGAIGMLADAVGRRWRCG